MPRSDDDPDFLQTYTSEGEGKSKSTRIAPLEVGRNGAPVRVFRHKELDPDALESPPQGVRFLLTDDTGELVQKNPDGTVTGVSGAPEDAEYVTTTESTALPNDTAHSTLTGANLHDPAQHGSTHEQGGTDELDVTGLSGDLADPQDPKSHASTHEAGGSDPVNADALSTSVASTQDLQTDSSGNVTTSSTPVTHGSTHENGAADEINVSGLSGDLADAQDPKAHQSTHQAGGSDELQVDTLGASSTASTQFFGPDGSGGVRVDSAGGVSASEAQEEALAVQFVMGGLFHA